jgi:hypothetical protein
MLSLSIPVEHRFSRSIAKHRTALRPAQPARRIPEFPCAGLGGISGGIGKSQPLIRVSASAASLYRMVLVAPGAGSVTERTFRSINLKLRQGSQRRH